MKGSIGGNSDHTGKPVSPPEAAVFNVLYPGIAPWTSKEWPRGDGFEAIRFR